MYTTKNHHSLLFSKWFPYFWKLVFRPTKGYHKQDFYGNAKKGYFCQLDNGLTYKIFRHMQKHHKEPTFAVYIYHHNKLVINYNTYSDSYISIVSENPFSYTLDDQISNLAESLKKAFPEDVAAIFNGQHMPFYKMPIFSFRISEYHAIFKWQYKLIHIKQFLSPTNKDKFDMITIVKRYNEYYSAKSKFSFNLHSSGFSKDFDRELLSSFHTMDQYTSYNRYYILYDLQPPKKIERLHGYEALIINKKTKGFLLDSDDNYFYFIFHTSFISFHNYNHHGPSKEFEIIKSEGDFELTFAKKLKDIMLELQKNKPSLSFCNHLNELGIEGIDISKRKPLTDEQWLLYEMMAI